jgi:hypothetical protein
MSIKVGDILIPKRGAFGLLDDTDRHLYQNLVVYVSDTYITTRICSTIEKYADKKKWMGLYAVGEEVIRPIKEVENSFELLRNREDEEEII